MITVLLIAVAIVAVYYFFLQKKDPVEMPRIVFNSPQVASKNEKVIEIVKAKLEQVEAQKAEAEAMQILSEIIPSAQASPAAKAAK